MTALVDGFTLNSSAANLITAVKGASSGTDITLFGKAGSDANVTLNDTFDPFDISRFFENPPLQVAAHTELQKLVGKPSSAMAVS
mmetsp:Transcript_15923/g.23247  ORF Transcript_15923/g.23247 Transcript_15923/m.23247 type:complete len:85 (-) Transcript_15923:98-352(-)